MSRSGLPGPEGWQSADPAALGMDPQALAAAVRYAEGAETGWPRDLGSGLNADPAMHEPPPWNEVLGPTADRGGPSGLVIRRGRIVARWGDPARVDMTFSVAKSYLAILTGVALGQGLIRDLDHRVGDYCDDGGFESPQNRDITWRHFLHQSSEWEGELFGKPDLVDRNRQAGANADNSRKGTHRDLGPPGSYYEYNDVRVNRLSLSLLRVFREPLPRVLERDVMRPIDASDTWRWEGYRNATVDVDGTPMVSVPGGAHWGGGIFINSEDHARVGQMVLDDGCWGARRILPEGFVDALQAPSPTNPHYGFLWWLNTSRELYPSAPASSIFAVGAGSNLIWLDRDLDLVSVVRWIDKSRFDGFIAAVLDAL